MNMNLSEIPPTIAPKITSGVFSVNHAIALSPSYLGDEEPGSRTTSFQLSRLVGCLVLNMQTHGMIWLEEVAKKEMWSGCADAVHFYAIRRSKNHVTQSHRTDYFRGSLSPTLFVYCLISYIINSFKFRHHLSPCWTKKVVVTSDQIFYILYELKWVNLILLNKLEGIWYTNNYTMISANQRMSNSSNAPIPGLFLLYVIFIANVFVPLPVSLDTKSVVVESNFYTPFSLSMLSLWGFALSLTLVLSASQWIFTCIKALEVCINILLS